MNSEEIVLIEYMIKEVAELIAGDISDVDAIWDKNYDKFIEMTVDENCDDKITCGEEVIHDEMADFRIMYYQKADELSYKCNRCGKVLYGKATEDKLCGECK